MSQIDELNRRIAAALDRIGAGVEGLAAQDETETGDTGELARLTQALEDEKLASAQLEERLRVLRDKHAVQLREVEKQAGVAQDAVAQLDREMQKLRQANDALRENNDALRRANETGVGEPHLINKAMLTELEALRAARAADRAEAGAIAEALAPLLSDEPGDDTQEESA